MRRPGAGLLLLLALLTLAAPVAAQPYVYGGGGGGVSGLTTNSCATTTALLRMSAANTANCSLILDPGDGSITAGLGTVTTSKPFAITQTWNDILVSFIGFDHNVTNTASATTSRIARWRAGGTAVVEIAQTGEVKITPNAIGDIGASLSIVGGTILTSQPMFKGLQTWNDGAQTFFGADFAVANTASAAASRVLRVLGGAAGTTPVFGVTVAGALDFLNGDIAVTPTSNTLTISGGDLVSPSFITATASPAATGVVRLAATDYIKWLNGATTFSLGFDINNVITISDGTIDAWASPYAAGGGALYGTRTNHPVFIFTNSTQRWRWDTAGHYLANSDNSVDIGATGATRPRTMYGATSFALESAANGAQNGWKRATTTVSASAGTTITATNLIPAGSLVLGVTTRVTTAFGVTNGLTSVSIGDGTDVDRWGATTGITLNTTTGIANFTTTSPAYYAAATSVVITGNGGTGFDADGVIRVTVFYMDITPPTS